MKNQGLTMIGDEVIQPEGTQDSESEFIPEIEPEIESVTEPVTEPAIEPEPKPVTEPEPKKELGPERGETSDPAPESAPSLNLLSSKVTPKLLAQLAHQVLHRVQLVARFVGEESVEELARQLTLVLEKNAYLEVFESYKPPSYLDFGAKDTNLTFETLEVCRSLVEELDRLGFKKGYLEQARLADNLNTDDIIFIVCDAKLENVLRYADLKNDRQSLAEGFLATLSYFNAERSGFLYAEEIQEVLNQTDPVTELAWEQNWLARIGEVLACFAERLAQLDTDSVDVCDFCGDELSGVGYDRLSDGRARCLRCSRVLVSSEEQFKEVFYKTLEMMQDYFDIRIVPHFKLRMVNAKQLHKQIGLRFSKKHGQQAARVLGFAKHNRDGSFELFVENGSPRLALISTLSHELTHIWQYQNWDEKGIQRLYGSTMRLPIYEGMAAWVQVQYLFFTKEFSRARREFGELMQRQDEYGIGFRAYFDRYSMDFTGMQDCGESPFTNLEEPL
ncbi:MAG: procyclic acidic repetitive family protein [Coriobacteriales bacterium]|jgi:hypothetical protein|nr:procyclic acidic repetitive family protein [Coriobacteriales bacterium]